MGARTPRAGRLAAAALLLGVACTRPPKVEPPSSDGAAATAAPKVTIESVAVAAADRKVVVTYRLTDGGEPITGAAATALGASWTLAWLSVDPVTPTIPAWRSLLLTGSQTAACLPPAGPGTPGSCDPANPAYPGAWLVNQKQPGNDSGGTTAELGDGLFTYTFSGALPAPTPPDNVDLRSETLRVGVNLRSALGTPDTSTTFDFNASGGTVKSYTLVSDDKCNACHGVLTAHGRRTGVKYCVACHTWLCTDPDTIDPAAPLATDTKAKYPNPMEFGRLVHRIHRGKKLPTLFLANDATKANRTWPPDNTLYVASPGAWPGTAFTAAPPLPYRNGTNAVAAAGTKFAIVGHLSTEYVFGRIASRIENFQPAKTLAEGVGYPQDLRNCDACHTAAARETIGTGTSTDVAISRRTCSGCHPDVFYGDPADAAVTAPDTRHLAHTGGKQLDDTACKDCHVVARTGGPKLYAPIAEIHRPLDYLPRNPSLNPSPRWSRVTGEIVSVQNMKAGQLPTVKFKLYDRNGPITPLDHPTTPMDLVAPTSPVPRRMTGLSLVLSGPTSDYVTSGDAVTRATLVTRRSTAPATGSEWWDIAAGFSQVADAQGVFTYTFTTALPSTASGTWAVEIEGRRRPDGTIASPPADYVPALPAYDLATDTFNWPYTGEAISEHLTNDVKYVDVDGTGAITTDPSRARRAVVDQLKCEKCHLELNLHGANRHDVAACVLCHTPDATDWDKRPRDTRTLTDGGVTGTGMVLVNNPIDSAATTKRWGYATMDGIEERSIHLKTMIHRIHVGEREGAASLEGIRPFAIYGMVYTVTGAPSVYFFDDVRFPGNLANCELCHYPNTWTIEAIPAGAAPTTANERGTILHTGTSAKPAVATHTSTSEPKVLPITAACTSCHTSGAAVDHAAGKTSGGVEQCVSCHGESGADSVRRWHAVP